MKPVTYFSYLLLVVLTACSNNAAPVSVQLPGALNIASIAVAGSTSGDFWSPANQTPLTLSCNDAPLIVKTDPEPDPASPAIDSFTLAEPGGCVNLPSCGWLVLRVDPGEASAVSVATRTSPITVEGVTAPGSHVFDLELHDASDSALRAPNGTLLWDEVTVEFLEQASCLTSGPVDAG